MDAFLDDLELDPSLQFGKWLVEALAAGLHEPESMALATSTRDGVPSVRMVLLRRRDERGLCFFTNRESRKATELDANPNAALVLHWIPPLQRQVRVEGVVERLGDDESLEYFRTRSRDSQIGAWASAQSRPLSDRAELDARVTEVEAHFADVLEIPLPPFWGGYRLVPDAWEFWQGKPGRLHDRVRYERRGDGWQRTRLAP